MLLEQLGIKKKNNIIITIPLLLPATTTGGWELGFIHAFRIFGRGEEERIRSLGQAIYPSSADGLVSGSKYYQDEERERGTHTRCVRISIQLEG